MTFEIRNEKVEEVAKDIGRLLKGVMPPNWGFTLLMFDYNKGETEEAGSMFYISTAQRADIIKAMEEFIEKQKLELNK